jgi:aspartate aminotransferase
MTGWRIGYIGAPKWIAEACDKIQGQFTSGASSIAQKAAEAALNGDIRPTQEMMEAFRRRRDLVLGLLQEIPGIRLNRPDGAFYVFADISSFLGKSDGQRTIASADDLCMFLLNTAHVSLVTGEAFGDPHCFRMSYATSDEKLREAVRRIREALSRLN